MAYRKLGVDNKHRRSMLANQTKDVIMNEKIVTTETRAKEVRKFVDKMITYGKNGSLVSRRKALAFLQNDTEAVKKVFDELAPRYKDRNGGYTRILIEHFEVLANLNEIADETGLMISNTEDPSVKILETSIDDLDFSVRAYNCLKRANILTLADLVDKSENEMRKIRNLGKKSFDEVINKVKDLGLSFRDEN